MWRQWLEKSEKHGSLGGRHCVLSTPVSLAPIVQHTIGAYEYLLNKWNNTVIRRVTKNIVLTSPPGLRQVLFAQHPVSMHLTVINGWAPEKQWVVCFLKRVKEHRPLAHSLPFQLKESTTPGSSAEMDLTFVFVILLRQELKSWQLFLPVSPI